jgi:molybdopterin-synthase adenylyltransferase
MMAALGDEDLRRYSRNIKLDEIGLAGQQRIAAARVLVIGVGGLGSPVALYLAAAGVGTLGLADADCVELSNLQRQILHATADLNRPKLDSAAEKLRALNPHVALRLHPHYVRADNILATIADYDFVLDCTDGIAPKFLINDACVMAGKPFSHAGVTRFAGQTMTVVPGKSACCRCLFETPPPAESIFVCAQVGVLGAVAGMLGTIQATEALKFVAGAGECLTDALLTFDALKMNFRKIPLRRNPHCSVCGDHPTLTELTDAG